MKRRNFEGAFADDLQRLQLAAQAEPYQLRLSLAGPEAEVARNIVEAGKAHNLSPEKVIGLLLQTAGPHLLEDLGKMSKPS